MENYRLFIAIELPVATKMALGRIQQQFPPIKAVRWTQPQNIHLTLQFLGDYPAARVQILADALNAVSTHQAFEINLYGIGAFPTLKRPRIIWVGVAESPALQALQRAVVAATTKIGITAEKKRFKPHLTIGRVAKWARGNNHRTIAAAISGAKVGEIATLSVTHIHLIRSKLTPQGPIYAPLHSVPLTQIAPTPR